MDYNGTFDPVAKMTIARTFLAIAASINWELHQMNVDHDCKHIFIAYIG